MLVPENRLFCRLDGLSTVVREQKRHDALQALRLLEADSIPIFEEVVQMLRILLKCLWRGSALPIAGMSI